MPNQSIRPPYGNIYEVSTPHIDRATNQLYQEQRQRELYKQQRERALDDEFKTMLPGIRSADVPKLADLWGDYKTSWIDLQKNPPKDQKQYLKKQQELIQKKAAVFQHNAGSLSKKEREKPLPLLLANDKTGRFKDEAYDIITQGLNLPYDAKIKTIDPKTGEPQEIDWTDPDSLKRHINTKAVFDAIKTATGNKAVYSGDKYKEKPDDLQFIQPEITANNTPKDFYDSMKISAAQNPYDFLNTLPHPSDDEYFNAEKSYNEMMVDKSIKKNWRMSSDLPSDDEIKTPIERAIKFQAMTYALNPNNQPRVNNKIVKDEDAERDRSLADALAKMNYNDKLIRRRMRLSQGYKQAFLDYKISKDEQQEEGILNQFIENSYEAGSDRNGGKTVEKLAIDGKNYTGRFIDVPKEIAKDFIVPKKDKNGKPIIENGQYVPIQPQGFYITDDKKTFIPIYFGSETKSGGNYILPESKPMDIQFYKTPLSKLFLSKKNAGSEVVDKFAGDKNGGFIPEIKTSKVEIHKQTKSSTKKDPLGLF